MNFKFQKHLLKLISLNPVRPLTTVGAVRGHIKYSHLGIFKILLFVV